MENDGSRRRYLIAIGITTDLTNERAANRGLR